MSTYKIINFDEFTGQLVVEYAVGMSPLVIDVPIENGLYITGKKLEDYIDGFIPAWHIERMNQINNGIANKDELKALVVQNNDSAVLPTIQSIAEDSNAKMWADIEFEQKVASALVKFGILENNPTEIPIEIQ